VSGNAIGSENGVDLICAQAGEGGGHTGDIPASILIPACVDAVKGHKSPLTGVTGTGKPVYVIGTGALCTTAGGSPRTSCGVPRPSVRVFSVLCDLMLN
jgi:NAD(P)H-dependent flavin oxidoreductase YrpB (nitropropane dioxygenase family)